MNDRIIVDECEGNCVTLVYYYEIRIEPILVTQVFRPFNDYVSRSCRLGSFRRGANVHDEGCQKQYDHEASDEESFSWW